MRNMGDYTLDLIDYKLFLILREEPLISINELSKRLGLSFHQIRNKINNMKSQGFLRPDSEINDPLLGKRKRTEVEAFYKPHKLGLQRIHVMVEDITDKTSLSMLFKLGDVHPYTHFRTLSYSPNMSMYYQFDIPPEAFSLHIELFEKLKKEDLFKDYWVVKTEESARSKMKFEYWDRINHSWEINNKELTSNEFESLWASLLNDEKQMSALSSFIVPVLNTPKLDTLDLQLLRELSINAKVSQKELSKFYKKDHTTISKRMKKFRKNDDVIAILYYNRKVFNITDSAIIKGKISGRMKKVFLNYVSKYFPFSSTVVTSNSDLMWYFSYPSGILSEILGFIWNKLENVVLFNLSLNKSRTYYFYPNNYDVEKRAWKISRDYIIEEPLNLL